MATQNNTDTASSIRDFIAGGGRLGGRSVAALTDILTTMNTSVSTKQTVVLEAVPAATTQTTGDGKTVFIVPSTLNGMNLVEVKAVQGTAGITGTVDVQIRNVTDSVDMLSTKITIDSTEIGTATAATPAVIDTTKDDVVTNDVLAIDVDAIASGTAGKGLILSLVFDLP